MHMESEATNEKSQWTWPRYLPNIVLTDTGYQPALCQSIKYTSLQTDHRAKYKYQVDDLQLNLQQKTLFVSPFHSVLSDGY